MEGRKVGIMAGMMAGWVLMVCGVCAWYGVAGL